MQVDFAGLTVLFGLTVVVAALFILKYQANSSAGDDKH